MIENIDKLEKLDQEIFFALNDILLDKLIEKTPTKTSSLADGWEIEPLGNFSYLIRNDNPYAEYVFNGTKPHIIRAKNKKFLRFKDTGKKGSGKKIPGNIAFKKDGYVFAKAVYHPGTKGLDIVTELLNDQKLWDKIFKTVE